LGQTQFTTLPVPETSAVVAQLKKVESAWAGFSENVNGFLKDQKASSLAYLKDHNVILLQEMNRAVFLMDQAGELGEEAILARLRHRLDELFGPKNAVSKKIQLEKFVAKKIEELRPKFVHSKCRVHTHLSATAPIYIPPEVLEKIVEGLVRNAIE
jgi:hypothetical protein